MRANKRKRFENLIFEKFKNERSYDRIKHNLLSIYDIMIERQPNVFCKLSIGKQLSLASTVSSIATSTVRQHMNENMPLSLPDNTKEFPLSQDWLFNEPTKIDI